MPRNTQFSQQTQSRPSKSLYNFGIEINYYRSYYSGIKAISYEYMRMAFPNATFTELMADFEKLPNSQYVQDRFVYTIFGGNIAIKNKVQDMLYLLSKDASASITISNYFYFRFKHPPKSVQDLTIELAKIDKERQGQATRDAAEQSEKVLDSIKRIKFNDSISESNQIETNTHYITIKDVLELVQVNVSKKEIQDDLFNDTKLNWDQQLSEPASIFTTKFHPDIVIKYYASDHSLFIETSNEVIYNNFFNALDTNHYVKTIYEPSFNRIFKALFKDESHFIYFTIYDQDKKSHKKSYSILVTLSH